MNSSNIAGDCDTLETVDPGNDSLAGVLEQNVRLGLQLLENNCDGSHDTFRKASTAQCPVCSEDSTVIGRILGLTPINNNDREDK